MSSTIEPEAVTYFVGSALPSISVRTLSDLHEVVDLIHTLVIDAPKIAEVHKDELLRALESIMNRIDEIEPQ